MDGLDFPIKHFEMMTGVANRLKLSGVQLLEATYACRTFGSWWFAFQIKGENFRIVWDGRDAILRLDADRGYKAPFSYEWTELFQYEGRGLEGDALKQRIQVLIEKAVSIRMQAQNVAEGDNRK